MKPLTTQEIIRIRNMSGEAAPEYDKPKVE